MDRPMLLAVALQIAAFALLLVAFVTVLRRLRRRLGAPPTAVPADRDGLSPAGPVPTGGWTDLAARWATDHAPAAPIATRATIRVGAVFWRNCVTVGAEADGLGLAVAVPLLGTMGRRPLLVPWHEIADAGPDRLYHRPARRVLVGRPPVAALVLPQALHAELVRRGRLAA